MIHEEVPKSCGYDVAALETTRGDHVGYVSIIPFSTPPEVISTGGGARFFLLHLSKDASQNQPLTYREIFHVPSLGSVRSTVSENPPLRQPSPQLY